MKGTLLTVMSIVLITACSTKRMIPPTAHVIELVDKTDSLIGQHFLSSDLQPWLPVLNGEPFSGARVSINLITDFIHNPSYSTSINAVVEEESNILERKKDIAAFNHRLDSIIKQAASVRSGRGQSRIFLPLAHALNELAMRQGQRTVILLSDCQENAPEFSVYGNGLALLKQDPDRLKDLIPITGKLTGIEVMIVHQPKSTMDDVIFDTVSTLLKDYLEDHGATVHITTSIYR